MASRISAWLTIIDTVCRSCKLSEHLKSLGKSKAVFEGLETFACGPNLDFVTLKTDECTANCPVTGQPDWYVVEVMYRPNGKCIESKTFKLYIQSFKNDGRFCESFAEKIAQDCSAVLDTEVNVTVTQKPRGGVSIIAIAKAGQ